MIHLDRPHSTVQDHWDKPDVQFHASESIQLSSPHENTSPAHPVSESPVRERSSSLTPPPEALPSTNADSNALTPLTDLSPAPETPKVEESSERGTTEGDTLVELKSQETSPVAPSPTLSNQSKPQPNAVASSSSTHIQVRLEPGAEGATILELNRELFKVSLEFQLRGIGIEDPKFMPYSQRLQSNLDWMARIAEQGQAKLPIMDAPPPLDFISTERIQQLYATMPVVFAKEIARSQARPTSGGLKRDRPEDLVNPANKRRDLGEHKMGSMAPPSSLPISSPVNGFSMPNTNGISNGLGGMGHMNGMGSSGGLGGRSGFEREQAAAVERTRMQARLQAQQQQQQQQQSASDQHPMMHLLSQRPLHPFVKMCMHNNPDFVRMSPVQQIQDMVRQQQQLRNRQRMGDTQNPQGSPHRQAASIPSTSPTNSYNNQNGFMGTPEQRQMLLNRQQHQQQQQRGGPSLQAMQQERARLEQQQQDRVRLEQQRLAAHSSPTHVASPLGMEMSPYPAGLRSNPLMTNGIGRSTQSPADNGDFSRSMQPPSAWGSPAPYNSAMSPPGGNGGGSQYGGGGTNAPSPQNWSSGGGGGGSAYDPTPRRAPAQQSHSPPAVDPTPSDFDVFNWNQ